MLKFPKRITLALWIAIGHLGTFHASRHLFADDSIDRILADAQRDAGVHPMPRCDDATFLRRVTLDLIGRVPSLTELERFKASPDRAAAVDRLLDSRDHDRFWSHLWTTMLVGRGERERVEREVLRQWLERQLAERQPVSQIAFELISAQGVTAIDGPVNYVVASREDPVMRLSRTFLSVQLDCAQCHDHPHDRWTNEDYQAMRRFFQPTRFREVSGGITVTDSGTDEEEEKPVFLTGRRPHTSAWRRELALMVVQSKPFSRAMVNRTWHWLMGRGIIDPVDGLSQENRPSVPELLEHLATDFRSSDFDLKSLIRQICTSESYSRQATTTGTTSRQESQRSLFSARTIRSLLPEQWIASVTLVLDRPQPPAAELAEQTAQLLGLGGGSNDAGDPFAWNATTQTLIRQLSWNIPPPLHRADDMFLATLARRPTAEERQSLEGQSSHDVIFALVHGNEFAAND